MTATPFSYVNDASDDSNEVCLHITYLFLKALVFVSNVFLLALLSHENLHSLPIVVSSVFSPESTPLVIQQSPLLYSANLFICVFFFYLFIYFIVIANILFFKWIAWNLLSTIPYSVSVSVSVSGFRISCFSAAVIYYTKCILPVYNVLHKTKFQSNSCPNKTVWSSNNIKTNQIILEKKIRCEN